MRRAPVVVMWIAALLAPPMAAQAEAFSLAWEAPAGCPSEQTVRTAVAREMDGGARSDGEPTLFARAEVTRTPAGYQLDLSVTTSSGTSHKRLSSAQCETFSDVVALEISLAAPSGNTRAAVTVRPEHESEPASESRPAFGGRVMAGAGSGATPWFAPTVGFAAALRWRALRFELGASYGIPLTKRYAAQSGIGARFESFTGNLRTCYALAAAPVELPLCLGGEFGGVQARGFGVEQAFTVHRSWAAALLVQAMRWPSAGLISGWSEVSAAVSLVRPTFRMRNLEPLYQVAPVVFRIQVGVELQID
jgi:hypothetical protein